MWTGLRTSEISGLTWDNVDLANGSILISEVMVRGVRKSNTKTNVTRNIKLNSRTLKLKLSPGCPQKGCRRRKLLIYKGKNGVADGARTHDNRNHNPGLYQLSYSHRSPQL